MGDEDEYDYMAPDVQEARNAVAKAIADYLAVIRPTENPYVVAWCAAAEWTNTELEQSGEAGRDTISPSEQSISATLGLGAYVSARYM